MRRLKRLKQGVIVIILVVSAILYSLADRYLIQHVEVANVSANTIEVTQTVLPASASANTSAIASADTSTQAETTAGTSGVVVSDDWNYQSEGVSIPIREVVTGSGSSTVIYFVADVQLEDATQLQNAFANNSFGRNIIADTSTIAEQNNAIFAINGDYYGFRTDGIVIRNGVIYRDVPARVGLAFYTK